MPLQSFAQLARNSLNRVGVRKQIDVALALERCQKVMDALLDEDTRKAVHPAYIRYKALTLACRHSSAAACVGPFEGEILEYVNRGLSYPIAERLRVILDTNDQRQ